MKICPLDRLLSGGMVKNSYNVRNSDDLKVCGYFFVPRAWIMAKTISESSGAVTQ